MKRKENSSRLLWFTLCVVLSVVALSVIPPFQLFGMTTSRVDVMSELKPTKLDVENTEEYMADIERLESELAMLEEEIVEEVDTLAKMPIIRYEWVDNAVAQTSEHRRIIRSEDLTFEAQKANVEFEDFDTLEYTKFERFIDKLASGEDVRIAFMGDSFVEGDILTSDLRAILQQKFGGRGVGFVPCDIPFATVRKSVKRTASGWTAYSVMKPKTLPSSVKDKFFISGYLASGKAGVTTVWRTTNDSPTLDSCTRARVLLYSRDSSRVTININDTLSKSFSIEGADYLREIYVEAPISSVRIKVDRGNVLCYGASLEGDGGVLVDNFSIRSNNGHALFGTSAKINRQADEMLNYDLVVLQYGLNIMQKGQRSYGRYRDQVRDMIAYAERCFPNAAILVLGVSDRWVKNEQTSKYEPIGSVDALTSYQRAAADSCGVVFWNTSKAMAQLGGMPKFVANGWAAKDYTHINYNGGKRIANELAGSIINRVRMAIEEQAAQLMSYDELNLPGIMDFEKPGFELAESAMPSPMNVVYPIINGTELGLNE